jgi:hypothetical protein
VAEARILSIDVKGLKINYSEDCLFGRLYPEDEGTTILRKAGKYPTVQSHVKKITEF